MSARRAAQSLLPQLTRGFRSSAAAHGAKEAGELSHGRIAHGDGHHGLRPGYTYDWEHGPHSLRPDLIPNFLTKYSIGMPLLFTVAFGIPTFAVWYQQNKLKTS